MYFVNVGLPNLAFWPLMKDLFPTDTSTSWRESLWPFNLHQTFRNQTQTVCLDPKPQATSSNIQVIALRRFLTLEERGLGRTFPGDFS